MTEVINGDQMGDNARKVLANFVSRIENLQEEKDATSSQMKDVYAEAKSMGFDTKAMRDAIKRRKLDRQEREEQDGILATYEAALEGMDGLV